VGNSVLTIFPGTSKVKPLIEVLKEKVKYSLFVFLTFMFSWLRVSLCLFLRGTPFYVLFVAFGFNGFSAHSQQRPFVIFRLPEIPNAPARNFIFPCLKRVCPAFYFSLALLFIF
jgi:hypothetical protein